VREREGERDREREREKENEGVLRGATVVYASYRSA